MLLRTQLFGKTYEFPDIRLLMGKANEEKSGDRLAGGAAESTAERAAAKFGLADGSGDSGIGINPVDDSYGSVARLLEMTHEIIRAWEIPTQNCVLSHVTTQMQCLRNGVPVGLVFQSLSGSQKGNDSFGISVGLLDEAYALAKKYCVPSGPNYMYFETGQGSALSANANNGWDQLTLEARNYGLARRYSPYQLNTVVGFIGPEYL